MSNSTEKGFVFSFTSKGQLSTLRCPVTIPVQSTVNDLVGRLVTAHNIPCYVEDELRRTLTEFINKETTLLQDNIGEQCIEAIRKCTPDDRADLAQRWEQKYQQGIKKYSLPETPNEELRLYEVYHDLIHSAALETVLKLEHTYAINVQDVNRAAEREIASVERRQQNEMERVVKGLGIQYTPENINELAQKHFEKQQDAEKKWEKELKDLRDIQKGEFRQWISNVHEDVQKDNGSINQAFVQKVRTASMSAHPDSPIEEREHAFPEVRMEESFTIHLGAQMKTMHNLRVLCADVLDLCRHQSHTIGGMIIPQPQRLQTAMSLFSNSLCGLVMLVDNRLNCYTGLKREFAQVCQQSTDFHFPDLEEQFNSIEKNVIQVNELRKTVGGGQDSGSVKSGSSGSDDNKSDIPSNKLKSGDFYITTHSNLSEVHTLFHMVTGDDVTVGDINSRHPVILGLRNILKVCFRHDVMTLTLPLLLTHEMTEEMTIAWCTKRAELVFKCVKGFMMEMASWGGKDSRTLQFLVPRGISEDLFHTLCTMLPQIFRVNNPLVVKSS